MLDLDGKKITAVKMHGGYFVPGGIGDLGDTLPPLTKSLALEMQHHNAGVFVRCTTPGKRAEFLIPWPNIKGVTYALEAPKPAAAPVPNAPVVGAA